MLTCPVCQSSLSSLLDVEREHHVSFCRSFEVFDHLHDQAKKKMVNSRIPIIPSLELETDIDAGRLPMHEVEVSRRDRIHETEP